MAIGPAIAAILAGLAAGASEGTVKRRQKEEELTRQIMMRAGFERASKGDTGFADNPDMSRALGKQGVDALLSYAQQVQQQNAQTEAGDAQARTQMFGTDPLGGLAIGKHGGTMAGTGGGPTVTGGPGGAVSVQEPGTGRTIPSLAPPAPEAALVQSVTGPAAGPADEEPSAAAIPPPSAPPPPAAPPTGLSRIQQGLSEGQSVSGKAGGVNFSVSGRSAGEKADEIGRRTIAEGIKAGRRPDEMIVEVFANGGKLPENFSKYGEKVFVDKFRTALKEAGVDTKSATTMQKIAATRAALEAGGSVPDAFKSMVGLTREDEHAIAGEVVTRALADGSVSFVQARDYAEARGLRLSKEDEAALGQREFGAVKTEMMQRFGLSPEQAAGLAAIAVKNDPRFVPPDERAAIREPAPMTAETRNRIYEETRRVPRLSDIAAATGPGATDIAGARKRAEGEATTLKGQEAEAVKTGQENVPIRPSAEAIKMEAIHRTSIKLGDEITKNYGKMEENFGGPFGIKSRITAGRIRLDTKSLQEVANLRTTVNVLKAQVGRAEAGAAIGPSERELYFKALPDIDTQSSVEFKANLKGTLLYIAYLRESQAIGEKNVNLRSPSGVGAPGAAAPTPGAPPSLDDILGKYSATPPAPGGQPAPSALPGQPSYPGYTGPGLVRQPDTPTTPPKPGMVWVKAPDGTWGQWDASKPIPEGYRR